MNPYLDRLRTQYNEATETITALQTRAAEEDRDMTDAELRSVQELGDKAKSLAEQIAPLAEIENRNRQVAELTSKVAPVEEKKEVRSLAFTQDRDPGHYRKGGERSFFADLYAARSLQDDDAKSRLTEHARALDSSNNGTGVVPPKWLTDEFEAIARQGRRVAGAVRNIDLGSDPRPLTLPKQTAGTDAVVGEQSAENGAVNGSDAWDSDVTIVTPKTFAGKQTVSRQMLDMSNPAVDQLIYSDLMSVYNTKIEALVVNAIVSAAHTAAGLTFATEAAYDGNEYDSLLDAAIAVRGLRKLPGDIAVMSVQRYGDFLKLKDETGRPLMPMDSAGPRNVIGVGSVATDGTIAGLNVLATDGISAAYPAPAVVVQRASDVLLFESSTLRFRYEEVAGPESVVLGIWGYAAAHVQHAGKSGAKVLVTAASA